MDVHFVLGSGIWQEVELWPRHIAALGTPVAAATQSSGFVELTNQTYAFFVDKTGALNAYSVDNTGIWKRQIISAEGTFWPNTSIAVSQQFGTADGFVGSQNQLDVFEIDVNSTLNVKFGFRKISFVESRHLHCSEKCSECRFRLACIGLEVEAVIH
ncbi:hypothetical protein RBB77_08335 [Tunturibacter psychrotolerans]|uniref:Uncharacterized protein n=1 Tax=Tunturiibacter psychrotolerans TaxID=3069686 RepID=A0AAU7ZVG7_9BACT